MKAFQRLLFVLFILCFSSNLNAQKIIDLADYGVKPDSKQDATPAIQKAINDAKKQNASVIRFPGGRIDIYPKNATKKVFYISNATEDDRISENRTVGLLFGNISGVTLEGNGTTLVFHGRMMMMALDHCKDVTIKDLNFDFDRPSMSEMTIISMHDSIVEAVIHKDSWYQINEKGKLIWEGEDWQNKNNFIAFYRPTDETMHYGNWQAFEESNAVDLGDNHVRFKGDFSKVNFRNGDILTVRDPYRDAVGVFNNQSHNISFDNLNFYYIHGLGILNQLSENLSFGHVKFAPNPQSGRVISSFADCLHFSNCYGQITIKNNLFSGTHDDPINVHGTFLQIQSIKRNKAVVRFMHHQTWGFNLYDAGDTIQFVNHKSLIPYGKRVVVASKMISPREIELEMDQPIDWTLEDGDCIENITKNPDVLIENNRLEHVLTRGMLITTPGKVVIRKNTFYKTRMQAILIADDCNSWFESGGVKNISIHDNRFIDCTNDPGLGHFPIAIQPEANELSEGKYVHRNIKIESNYFKTISPNIVRAFDVNDLVFTKNKIEIPDEYAKNAGVSFRLDYCKNISVKKNRFMRRSGPVVISFRRMNSEDIIFKPKKKYRLIDISRTDF